MNSSPSFSCPDDLRTLREQLCRAYENGEKERALLLSRRIDRLQVILWRSVAAS